MERVQIVTENSGDDTKFFHTDVLFSQDFQGRSRRNENPVVDRLLNVHGVQTASVDRYKIRVERGLAVRWEDILPEIEKIIREEGGRIAAAKP